MLNNERGIATLIVLLSLLGLGILLSVFMRGQNATISTITKMDEKAVSTLRAESVAREIMKKISSGQSIGYGNLIAPADIGTCTGDVTTPLFKIPADGLCRVAERIFSLKVIGCGDDNCVVWTEVSAGFEVEE